ncbi:type VI secretion protein [Streptomyces sp. NBC_00344]
MVFLLGLTVLVWVATGLAGLFAHGSWPDGVTVSHTPAAIRQLVAAPKVLPAAWPDTPPAQLSGYGLFWGLLIGELMALLVLTVFVLGTVTRWRTMRAAGRASAAAAPGPGTTTAAQASGTTAATAVEQTPRHTPAPVGEQPPHPAARPPERTAEAAAPPGVVQQGGTPAAEVEPPVTTPMPAIGSATPVTASQAGSNGIGGADHGSLPDPAPATPGAGQPGTTTGVGPRIVYGPAETRRPAALQAVRDAAGPALVVTSLPAIWAETKDARAKLGPVLVYDPGHLCDTPARLHWSPTAGCESADIAAARATALLAPVRPQARIDAAMADTAHTLLSSWLHAAAIDGRPFKQVHRWAQGSGPAHEPVRILRTHPKASGGAAGLLESALTAYPERREIAQELTTRSLSALSSIHIREACTPNRSDTLILESFVHEGGTLYVVGEAIEDPRTRPGAMPLLTALVSSVVEHGRRLAARSTDGRLDPPMTLVLEDIAAVAPLPQLPELLSAGRDHGLTPLVLLRSPEQQRSRWPETLPR